MGTFRGVWVQCDWIAAAVLVVLLVIASAPSLDRVLAAVR
jgi:hypothetical protein